MKLIIRNLNRCTTEAQIRASFAVFGTVQSCNLVIDRETGASKGFGFVVMAKPGDAKAAMKNLNGTEIDDNRVRVKRAEVKPDEAKK
jgi:RNA recognition motif-containing protein